MENKELIKKEETPLIVHDDSEFACYLDTGKFNQIWRVAKMFAESDLVPDHYRRKTADCMIAFNQAVKLKIDPMLFMQKTYIVHKKLGIEAQMAIALVNNSGIFKDLINYEWNGEKTNTGDTRKCIATAITQKGMKCTAECSVQEAKDMGWWNKNALWSKMTSTFLSYRAAMKLIRLYCPQVLMGMETKEELLDSEILNITPEPETPEILNLKKVEKKNNVDPFEDTPEKIAVKKKEQPAVKQILHPKTELLKKYFEDSAYLEVFDMLEETETVTKQKVKAIILDDDSKEAVTILNEIDKITDIDRITEK